MEDHIKKMITLMSLVFIAAAYTKIEEKIEKNDFDALYEEISALKDDLNDCFESYSKLNTKAKAKEGEKC